MNGILELGRSYFVYNRTVLAAVDDREFGSMILEHERELSFDECEELASALFEDASAMLPGPKKRSTLKLAQSYRSLGKIKRLVLQNVS